MSIPERYIPESLSGKDKKKQRENILNARKSYIKHKYLARPTLSSFHSKPSNHIQNAKKMYDVENVRPTPELSRKTKCSLSALRKIVNKGEGAYFSQGSRPNQTAQSWGYARLGSAITGKNASIVDYHILEKGCKSNSPALLMAKKTCKKQCFCLVLLILSLFQ
jgi:hypothetical protein